MRAEGRVIFPDLAQLLRKVNTLLSAYHLPVCDHLEPVADGDTANPNAIGYAAGRKYVIKVTQRHPDTLGKQLELANELRKQTSLPIPEHLCCSYGEGQLPIMIMEWLPGVQLRTIFESTSGEPLYCVLRNLAKSMAIFHSPDLLSLVDKKQNAHRFAEWWRRKIEPCLTEDRLYGEIPVKTIRNYLDMRMSAMDSFAIPSLTKADQDLRDFLVNQKTGDVTGMLDWERVDDGDALYEVAVIFLRLWLADKVDGWDAFRDSYDTIAERRLFECPQFEFYLMCRAILAGRVQMERAKALISVLLDGQRLLFGKN